MKLINLLISVAAVASILTGIWMIGQVGYTIIEGGYVILPARFRGNLHVTPEENVKVFIGVLATWLAGGGVLVWLGWKWFRMK